MPRPKTEDCRKYYDQWVKNCRGGEVSEDARTKVKLASDFCIRKAPYLSPVTTKPLNKIRTIEDPIIQGDVLKHIKKIIQTKIDPRTGKNFKHPSEGITTPLITWLIDWVKTGEKPIYIPRSSRKVTENSFLEILAALDELLNVKLDRRSGVYPVSPEQISRIKSLRERISCNLVSQAKA